MEIYYRHKQMLSYYCVHDWSCPLNTYIYLCIYICIYMYMCVCVCMRVRAYLCFQNNLVIFTYMISEMWKRVIILVYFYLVIAEINKNGSKFSVLTLCYTYESIFLFLHYSYCFTVTFSINEKPRVYRNLLIFHYCPENLLFTKSSKCSGKKIKRFFSL